MKILTVCDQGNNRSVTLGHLLKYKYKADVLPVGLQTTSQETLDMLFDWADVIVVTAEDQISKIPPCFMRRIRLFEIGEDKYPRPFNPELLAIAKKLIEEHPLV